MGQDAVDANTNQLPLRTNPQDVRLATLASSANTAPSSNESSQDQWRSLATPQNDPMVTPSPSPIIPTTNNISPLISESKPKPVLKKDDYGPQTGWGLRTSAGVALQQSISASRANGSVHTDINFQPGFRWDFEPYYNVANGFSFGMETGFIYNKISSILSSDQGGVYVSPDGATVSYPPSTPSGISGSQVLGDAAFYQVPLLLNMRFQIPNSGRFRGYCMGGFGGAWEYTTASVSKPVQGTPITTTNPDGSTTTTSTISFIPSNISDHQWNFAFQLGAGFQYNLLPGLDLDTSFKTFITPNPLIFSDGTSQVKASYNYALEIGLAYRF